MLYLKVMIIVGIKVVETFQVEVEEEEALRRKELRYQLQNIPSSYEKIKWHSLNSNSIACYNL